MSEGVAVPKIIKSIPFLVFHLIHFKISFATKNKPVVTGYFISEILRVLLKHLFLFFFPLLVNCVGGM